VYNGLRIVDSSGMAFMVSKYRINRPSSRFGQALARFFETTVRVELQVEPIEPPSLDELKAVVQDAINDDPESFEELSGKSVEWWRGSLDKASSLEDVVNAFTQSSSEG
jgi:hypothetical protein